MSLVLVPILLAALAPKPATAADPQPAARPARVSADREAELQQQFQANQLLKRAQAILAMGETDRAVRMLETVLEQHPGTPASFEACLTLGKHHLQAGGAESKALACLARLNELKPPEGPVPAKVREFYLEGLYLTGVAHYQVRNYGGACAVLRKITEDYPDTAWANRAHYTIGLCHFAQKRWADAIRSLSLVGTFVGAVAEGGREIDCVEAGRRLFVKIEDGDLPVLRKLGRPVTVAVTTAKGDSETITCLPLAERTGGDGNETGQAGQAIYVGSIQTAIGSAVARDNVLQVLGGDEVTVTYLDAATEDGGKDVPRTRTVRVVSTATLTFTTGTFQANVSSAFLGQPVFLLLRDEDMDTSPSADQVTVKVQSRYRAASPGGEPAGGRDDAGGEDGFARDEPRHVVRDEVTVRLSELRRDPAGPGPSPTAGGPTTTPDEADASGPIHTGQFAGAVRLAAVAPGGSRRPGGDDGVGLPGPGQPGRPDRTDAELACCVGDEIVAVYVDDLHMEGGSPRRVESAVGVVGRLDSRPRASQDEVADPVILARKQLVEATAFLELARIFEDMGLSDGAAQKADEGLTRAEAIIRQGLPIPPELKQDAYRLKWELCMVRGDMGGAVATCRAFNRLWPDSPLVDQALMSIARVRIAEKDYTAAVSLLRQVLALTRSQAKAEAQFLIAQAAEAQAAGGDARAAQAAIEQYRLCAQRYPDSQFAGPALAKLVQHHIDSRDYAQARDLLGQIFRDHPDADFLDVMLLKWVELALRTGDYATAKQKCEQLILAYPGSEHARKAREVYLPEATKALDAVSPTGDNGASENKTTSGK